MNVLFYFYLCYMKKKILFFSLAICTLICFSCNNKKINDSVDKTVPAGTVFKLDEEVTLKDKESAVLDGENLIIEVLEINDSRCPVGTNCIRAGEVRFSLLLKSKDKELKTILSNPVKGYQLKGAVSFEGYKIALTGATQKNDDKLNPADLGGIFMVTSKE